MNTPIFDFVSEYIKKDVSRFHMPGHKGHSFLGCEERDITEIDGADVLYNPSGIIEESENNATSLFKTGHTYYSAEGSSLSIKTMLALAVSEIKPKRQPHILAARNAHKAFIYACALLDLRVTWMYPSVQTHLCTCTLTAEDVESAIRGSSEKPDAVYLTSPDYLGQRSDIAGIARICKQNGIPLLVDNAHGAYLAFLSPSQHPIAQGAFMCCDSAHKTLPVLTGGAYLQLSSEALQAYGHEKVRNALSLFASTSPSYLILQSLDLCNRYLAQNYSERLSLCVKQTSRLKERLTRMGYAVKDSEPLKLVLELGDLSSPKDPLAAHLRQHGIEYEYEDGEYLVLMTSPELTERDFARAEQAFAAFPLQRQETRTASSTLCRVPIRCETVMTPSQAILSPSETVDVSAAIGRVCAAPTVSCPPAIPIVISGERISHEASAVLQAYGIHSVAVVKENT